MTRQPSGWRRRMGFSVLVLLSPLLSVVGWVSPVDAVPACTIYWTGGAGDHAWANTSNWSTNQLSDGTDSAPLPGETSRVCVAANPVSRGAVVDGIADDVNIDSIRFPGVADSLTVKGTRQAGAGTFVIGPQCCDLPVVKRASTIGSLTIEGGSVRTMQPLTVAGPVRIDAEGQFFSGGWDGTYKTRFRSEVDVTNGGIVGDVILLGHTTFGSLYAGGGVRNRGTMTGAPSCILRDANGDPKVHPSVINEGTITGSGEPDSYCALDMVANRGTIRGTGGELYISSPDFVHNVLTGGRYEVTAGVLGFEYPVFDNRAILRTRGEGRLVNYGGLPTLQYLERNSGTLDLANDVTDDVDLVNTGTVVLRSAATLTAKSYGQKDGSTRLLARSRIAADADVSGGSIGGEGNGFVDGDLTLGPGATTKVQVRPTGADRLTVSGAASLDGRLLVDNAGSFEPDPSASYRFLGAGSRTGAFSSVDGEAMALRTYGVEYQADGARLVLQPLAHLSAVDAGPFRTSP